MALPVLVFNRFKFKNSP
jgi:hypothetical protein